MISSRWNLERLFMFNQRLNIKRSIPAKAIWNSMEFSHRV